ncbi:MAG: PaaI family thioesterase [Acidiferrobacterales bacterium]
MTFTCEDANARIQGTLPGVLGIEFFKLQGVSVAGRLALRPEHLAPNGYLHAATIIALADTCCGNGTLANLPKGAENFTTVELKSNFFATVQAGAIVCRAQMVHGGRRTQVWDATVTDGSEERTLALFRCTQMILYPRQ